MQNILSLQPAGAAVKTGMAPDVAARTALVFHRRIDGESRHRCQLMWRDHTQVCHQTTATDDAVENAMIVQKVDRVR